MINIRIFINGMNNNCQVRANLIVRKDIDYVEIPDLKLMVDYSEKLAELKETKIAYFEELVKLKDSTINGVLF